MEGNLKSIEIKDLNAGIQARSSDLAIEGEFEHLPLKSTAANISFGKRRGISTRYGMAIIPGHASLDYQWTISITGGKWNFFSLYNLMQIENSGAGGTANVDYITARKYLFGAITLQVPLNEPSGGLPIYKNNIKPVTYWLISRKNIGNGQDTTNFYFDLVASTTPVTGRPDHGSAYELPLGGSGFMSMLGAGIASENGYTFYSNDRLHTTKLTSLRRIETNTTRRYMIYAQAKINIKDRTKDCAMHVTAANHAVDPGAKPYGADFYSFGMPYCFYSQKLPRAALGFSVAIDTGLTVWQTKHYFSSQTNDLNAFNRVITPNAGITPGFFGAPNDSAGNDYYGKLYFNLTNATYTKTSPGAATSYWYYLKFDEDRSNSYPATFIAFVVGTKPVVALHNERLRESVYYEPAYTNIYDRANDFLQWIDPTSSMFKPRSYPTTAKGGAPGAKYTETYAAPAYTSPPIQTCFMNFPLFNDTAASAGVEANKGILQQYTMYEVTYSIYNAFTGKESNVGIPAKIYTHNVANAAFLLQGGGPMGTPTSNGSATFSLPGLADFEINGEIMPINFLMYRFYYREVGSFEWVFARESSYAEIHFYNSARIYIGTGEGAGLPGGQPGGFVDYSDLPQDEYIDVKSFARRMWWMTKNSVRFSIRDELFSYPLRNNITCDSDDFKGMIPHYFSGQADQFGRLVVFGSKNQYEIRETTTFQYQQVRVSPTASPQVMPIPDSNIVVSVRSSNTAFSGRCAVVAEGVLYFWGPNGIFRDDGVSLPLRISEAIEPDLFSSCDLSQVNEFFAYYNKKSKEILFFYRPTVITSISDPEYTIKTKAWVYSLWSEGIQDGQWYPGAWTQYKYKGLIDWAQEFDTTGFDPPSGPGTQMPDTRRFGQRTMVGAASSSNTLLSRGYFHDDACDCGDLFPGQEMVVKSVTATLDGYIRFKFNTNFSASILANALIGDTVYVTGSNPNTTVWTYDGAHTIRAIGADYIDVNTPSLSTDEPSIGSPFQFGVYFKDHAFSATIDTNFFAPYGVTTWLKYRYIHLLTQPPEKYPRGNQTYAPVLSATMSWNANHTESTSVSKTFSIAARNTREVTTQVVFDMQSPGMQSEGQGISLTVVYNQIGGRWTLYALTLWHSPFEGKRNLLIYQQ